MNTNQSGSLPGPRSNASRTLAAGNATEHSNGKSPYGNSQEIDYPTEYGIAMHWKRSNGEYDHSKYDTLNPEDSGIHADFAPKVKKYDETGDKDTLESSEDEIGNNGTRDPTDPTVDSGSRTDERNEKR